jgi:MFS family permease
MSKMSRKNRLLLLTFICTSFLQMPFMALNPVIEYMQTTVFPDKSLAQVQTAISSLNLFVMLFALLAAFVVARRILSKKAVVVAGLLVFGATGIAAILLHDQFWNIWLLSVLIGAGSGLFISTLTSVLFDSFSEKEIRMASGLQASAVNIGGIVFGALGGVLATVIWYGGYLLELVGLPFALLALLTIPAGGEGKKPEETAKAAVKSQEKKTRLPKEVLYYGLTTFLFFMLYIACGSNIAPHLARANMPSPAIAGLASAVQMAGGAVAGLLFSKLSAKLHDMLLPISFAVLFVGFTILNLGQSLLILDLAGVFFAGASLSMVFPYCIFSTSKYVDETNSATGTSLVQAMAPGIGGFVSPMILTNLTQWIGGDSTKFRYQFIGFVALALAVIYFLITLRRNKRSMEKA